MVLVLVLALNFSDQWYWYWYWFRNFPLESIGIVSNQNGWYRTALTHSFEKLSEVWWVILHFLQVCVRVLQFPLKLGQKFKTHYNAAADVLRFTPVLCF